jgi:hypothetical protein
MATFDECEAVSNAVGRDVSASEIDAALERYKGQTREELEQKGTILFVGFEHSGGRDVELADTLDAMLIAIEVLKFRETNG